MSIFRGHRFLQCFAAALVLAALTAWPVAAQETASRPAAKVEDVISQIPADCTGFVLLRSGQGFADSMKDFLLAFMPSMVREELQSRDLAEMAYGKFDLGETFNPRGPVAVVMLNMTKYAPPAASQPAGEDDPFASPPGDEPRRIPVVICIPGSDAMTMFASANPKKEGGLVVIGEKGHSGSYSFYARDAEGFVMLSPMLEALKAMGAGKSVDQQMNAQERALMGRHDMTVWMKREQIGLLLKSPIARSIPILGSAMESSHGILAWLAGPQMPLGYIGMTRGKLFSTADTICIGATFSKRDLASEVRCTFAPDSLVGKALAGFKPAGARGPDRLPELPWTFAYSAVKDFSTPKELKLQQYQDLFKNKPFDELDEDARKQIIECVGELQDQVTAVQHSFGPLAEGGSVITFLTVAEVKDSKAVLATAKRLAEAVGKATMKDQPEGTPPYVKYVEGALESGGRKLDAVVVEPPGWDDQDGTRAMKMILNDDKVRLYLAAIDDKTIVTAFGGGADAVEKLLEAAVRKGGKFADDEQSVKALSALPKEHSIRVLLNPAVMYNLYSPVVEAMMGSIMPIVLPRAKAAPPIAAVVSFDSTGWQFTCKAPTASFKSIADAIEEMQKKMMGGIENMIQVETQPKWRSSGPLDPFGGIENMIQVETQPSE